MKDTSTQESMMEPKLREAKCRGKGFATYPAGRRRLREDKVPLPLLDERGLARAEMAAGVPLHPEYVRGEPLRPHHCDGNTRQA